MAERSFSHLPISSSSHIGKKMRNNRSWNIPVSEHCWIHAIPVIVFLCFFTLWCFSLSVNLEIEDGEIISVHRLEKSFDVSDKSHVSFAILASSVAAVSPPLDSISANQNLTTHQNATESVNEAEQPLAG